MIAPNETSGAKGRYRFASPPTSTSVMGFTRLKSIDSDVR